MSCRPFLDARISFAEAFRNELFDHSLHPSEQALLSEKAPEKRVVEFSLGRIAAKKALLKIGIDQPPPILRASEGEPVWPPNIKGSIAHTSGRAWAAASDSEEILSIGIDLETLDRAPSDAAVRRIASLHELEWIEACPEERSERFIRLFSAKEAFYKAWYTGYGLKLNLPDIRFETSGGLSPSPDNLAVKGARICFDAKKVSGLILSVVVIEKVD